jgi:hypothetical protein
LPTRCIPCSNGEREIYRNSKDKLLCGRNPRLAVLTWVLERC